MALSRPPASAPSSGSILATPPDEWLSGCPVCASPRSIVVARAGVLYNRFEELTPLVSHLCLACAVIYTNPRLSRATLARFYDQEQARRWGGRPITDLLAQAEAGKTARRVEFVMPFLPPTASVLEVGSGEGHVLAGFARRLPGGMVTGLDPSLPEDAAPLPQVRLVADRIDEHRIPSALSPPYHCVAAFHVVEHQHDPVGFLRQLGRLLRPDGLLYLEVPNTFRPFWTGKSVEVYFNTVHLTSHGRRSLRWLLDAAGFTPLAWSAPYDKGLRVVSRRAPDGQTDPGRPLTPSDVAAIQRYFALWTTCSAWRRARARRQAAPLLGLAGWWRVRRALAAAGM